MAFFSSLRLEVKIRNVDSINCKENPSLTSIPSIYPFAFPNSVQTILTTYLAAFGSLAIGIRLHH